MEENTKNSVTKEDVFSWIKNPYILIISISLLVIIGYIILLIVNSSESPFTTYKPLPVDSTFITLEDTTGTNDTFPDQDTVQILIDNNEVNPVTNPEDTSEVSSLFRLNTNYEELDPNQELLKDKESDHNDLFSQLMLSKLTADELEKIQDLPFGVGIKPILKILSSTAIIILSGEYWQYHLDILEALEQSAAVSGMLISDSKDKIVYATNKKYKNLDLSEVFPEKTIIYEKLTLLEMEDYQVLAFPVYHQYGRIGMVFLLI